MIVNYSIHKKRPLLFFYIKKKRIMAFPKYRQARWRLSKSGGGQCIEISKSGGAIFCNWLYFLDQRGKFEEKIANFSKNWGDNCPPCPLGSTGPGVRMYNIINKQTNLPFFCQHSFWMSPKVNEPFFIYFFVSKG